MHWSTFVYYALKFTYSNVHLLWVFVLNDCVSNLSSEDNESAKLQKKKKKKKKMMMKAMHNSQHLQLRRIIR
jgi:hypothetical protein